MSILILAFITAAAWLYCEWVLFPKWSKKDQETVAAWKKRAKESYPATWSDDGSYYR